MTCYTYFSDLIIWTILNVLYSECPGPCDCHILKGTYNLLRVSCTGKELMSFPWKIPLTTATLWVLTRDQLLRCHVSCRLNCRLRSKWMSFFILTEWERLLNQSYTSLCVVLSTSMTGNSSILNFLIVGFLRGSFLTRTTVSQVCRAK